MSDIEDDDVFVGDSDDEVSDIKGTTQSAFVDYHDAIDDLVTKQRKTRNFMSKFEYIRLLAIRSQQILSGSPVYVDRGNLIDAEEIAKKELKENKIPLIIRRKLPNHTYEDWKTEDLIIPFNY